MFDLESKFKEIASLSSAGLIKEALSSTSGFLRGERRFDEAFEIDKCLIRHQFGLPINFKGGTDALNLPQQHQLEEQLLDLCREIGAAHLEDGQLERGWMYLQPLMDRQFVESLFAKIEVDEDNVEELIAIGLGQWAAPRTGYRFLIETRGTCNAITFFDTQINFQDEQIRSELAGLLVQHVYDELVSNVTAVIVKERKNLSHETIVAVPLETIVADHKWIFDSCGHHLDVSHLVSTVRIARFCQHEHELNLARQIAIYGEKLEEPLQLHGEPPFEKIFEAHSHYFDGMLNRGGNKCVEYFSAILQQSKEPLALDTLVKIHIARGQSELAIQTAIEHCEIRESGAELLEWAESKADFEQLKEHYRAQKDLASYCVATAAQASIQKKPSH